LKFYLPTFEDLVDPEYDFINDRPSPRRHDRFAHDWYAHQFFSHSEGRRCPRFYAAGSWSPGDGRLRCFQLPQ